MKDNTPILDFETCERIGYNAEEAIFSNAKKKLKASHPSDSGMPYYDNLALDIYQSEELLSSGDTPAKAEILEILRDEYRNLNELDRHCLFLYLGSSVNEESELVNDLAWHFEEEMMDRVAVILGPCKKNDKLVN